MNNKTKIFIALLITLIIMLVSNILIYTNISSPKFYKQFIDTGVKYLLEGSYEEAILIFNKAIEIQKNSTEARIYLPKSNIGNHEYNKTIEVLQETQELDITN